MYLVQTSDWSGHQRVSAQANGVTRTQKNQMTDGHIQGSLGHRMSQGLRAGEFHLMFQGAYQVGSGRLSRIEAQVRWTHPQYGLLLPGAFVSQLEQSDVAYEMSCFMVERACHELGVCHEQELEPCPVTISVHPSVAISESFTQDIRETAQRYGIAPNLLELELSESDDAARDERRLRA